jgi:hypothetical protein
MMVSLPVSNRLRVRVFTTEEGIARPFSSNNVAE